MAEKPKIRIPVPSEGLLNLQKLKEEEAIEKIKKLQEEEKRD